MCEEKNNEQSNYLLSTHVVRKIKQLNNAYLIVITNKLLIIKRALHPSVFLAIHEKNCPFYALHLLKMLQKTTL
jgi:hypothetical protein